jgi:hypothetical protein
MERIENTMRNPLSRATSAKVWRLEIGQFRQSTFESLTMPTDSSLTWPNDAAPDA